MSTAPTPTTPPVPVPPPPPPQFDLEPGLYKYYSSQAEVMLSQYENINRLLGPTHDWTHPGDLCETLLRDFLRKYLPATYSIDKGFIYGRSTNRGKDVHSPEIDVLIHDSSEIRPLFRMGDFAIVRPQTVRGIIQVKRKLTNKELKDGLRNVVDAKQHLLDSLWSDKPPKGWGRLRTGGQPPQVFTGVIGFEDDIGHNPKLYQKYLLEENQRCLAFNRAGHRETNLYVLPAFMGSLKSHFMFLSGPGNILNQQYFTYESIHRGGTPPAQDNVCIQALLLKFFHVLMAEADETPPFAWPEGMRPLGAFTVLDFLKAKFTTRTMTLYRNDGWSIAYPKATIAPTGTEPNFVADSKGALQLGPKPLGYSDVIPKVVLIKRGSVVERYERPDNAPPPKAPRKRK